MKNREKFAEVFGFHADELNIMPCTNECPHRKTCEALDMGRCRAENWWNEEYKEPKR